MEKLPSSVQKVLEEFKGTVLASCGTNGVSIVLYGSAAEGRLRSTSDVNLILVLNSFEQAQVSSLIAPFRAAHAAIQLKILFLLKSEIDSALESFAVKFADVLKRRQILHGEDPFAHLSISRDVEILQLKQTLFNLLLRLRESYVLKGIHEDRLALVIAEMAGPIRVCAATLLELQGDSRLSPKEALEQFVTSSEYGSQWKDLLPLLSQARENRTLPSGTAVKTLFGLMSLVETMKSHLEKIK